MKRNLITTAFAFLLVGFSTMAYGQKAEILVQDGRPKVTVWVSKGHLPLQVTFLDQDNKVVFEDRVLKLVNLGKIYDLSALEDGRYTLKMETKFREVNKEINLFGGDVAMNDGSQRFFAIPAIDLGNGFFDVKFNSTRIANLDIAILDRNGKEVFEDKIGGVVAVNKRYQISSMDRGEYTIKVTTPDKVFYKELSLR
jgi:hypothetical protein